MALELRDIEEGRWDAMNYGEGARQEASLSLSL